MLKIVVCDSGWGGELVADFLSEELSMVEVIRVIDWPHAPYYDRDPATIGQLVETALGYYLNQVDLVVLGGYTTSLALDYLRSNYPDQRFVGMSHSLKYILHTKNYPSRVGLLAGKQTLDSGLAKQLHRDLPHSVFIPFDCSAWENLIDDGELSAAQIQAELSQSFKLATEVAPSTLQRQHHKQRALPLAEVLKLEQKIKDATATSSNTTITSSSATTASSNTTITSPNIATTSRSPLDAITEIDAVLLLDTHLWEIKPDLERLFGWRVRVLDFRCKLLHDACFALGLRGVDGGRGRH